MDEVPQANVIPFKKPEVSDEDNRHFDYQDFLKTAPSRFTW